MVRDTHPDHGSNIVTSGGSNWSGSIVNEPGLGYHLVSRPNVKGHEQRFPTLELLVQHYAHHPYEIDFAGGRFKLLDITQPGPMYSATANAMSGLYRRVMDRIRSQSIVRYLISKSEDDYRRDLWYDFNCTIWAARCLSFAARDCTRHEQTAAAHVIHDKFGEIVVELLRTLVSIAPRVRPRCTCVASGKRGGGLAGVRAYWRIDLLAYWLCHAVRPGLRLSACRRRWTRTSSTRWRTRPRRRSRRTGLIRRSRLQRRLAAGYAPAPFWQLPCLR